uniref:Uncharacterized protein n=1 Tax=Arundo donax TaxID=35708 RepID=A0A0A9FYL5_ARUDO
MQAVSLSAHLQLPFVNQNCKRNSLCMTDMRC